MNTLLMSIETVGAKDIGLGIRFRYVDPHDSDEGAEPWLTSYTIFKKTPKGCWIVLSGSEPSKYNQKFILDGHGRRYAYSDRTEALESYIIRKQRQVQHSAATHDKAQKLLVLARRMQLQVAS